MSGSASFGFFRGVFCLARRDARGIHAAHLPGADADRGAILGVNDGVGFDVLGDTEGKAQVAQLGFARRALGHRLELHVVNDRVVA